MALTKATNDLRSNNWISFFVKIFILDVIRVSVEQRNIIEMLYYVLGDSAWDGCLCFISSWTVSYRLKLTTSDAVIETFWEQPQIVLLCPTHGYASAAVLSLLGINDCYMPKKLQSYITLLCVGGCDTKSREIRACRLYFHPRVSDEKCLLCNQQYHPPHAGYTTDCATTV